MTEPLFADLVGKHFAFLSDEYGFKLGEVLGPYGEPMGNSAVTWESAASGIQIVDDRRQVFISLGPTTLQQRDWYDIAVVVRTFAPEVDPVYIFSHYLSSDSIVPVETQVRHLAHLMHAHCRPVLLGDWSMSAMFKATRLGRYKAK